MSAAQFPTPGWAGLLDRMGHALAGLAATAWPLAGAGVAGLAVAFVVRSLWWRLRERAAWRGAARVEILAAPRVDPAGALVFWQHLLGLLRPRWLRWAAPHVVFEYEFSAGGLTVSVWVPGTVAAAQVAAAARSAWPGARTTITPATPPTSTVPATRTIRLWPHRTEAPRTDGWAYAGGRMRLARPAALPIATEHRVDPTRAFIGAVGALAPSQTACIQILARPLSGARMAALARRRTAGPVGIALRILSGLAGAAATLAQEVMTTTVQGPAHSTSQTYSRRHTTGGSQQRAGRLVDSAQDRASATKAHGAGGGFTVAVRYLATTPNAPTTPAGTDSVEDDGGRVARAVSRGRAHAIASAFAEYSAHNYFRRRRLHHPAQAIAARRLRRGDPLSVAEVAALAHLPTDDHVPGLRRAGAAAIAPPPQVPTTGAGVRPLGVSDLQIGRSVGVSVPDARHHLWILGATGAGKSTLCVHGVLADADVSRAAIVLDPKGDLVTDITARLPGPARARTILIDPDRPGPHGWPCLNPLNPISGIPTGTSAANAGAVGDTAVENIVSVFSRVFASAWGHRSEDLFRVACLTVRAGPGPASLAQIPELLTDKETRDGAVAALDPSGRLAQFWSWYGQLPDSTRAQIAAPLLNKLRAILLRPFAEALLCGESTVNLAEVLDSGGLLLVRLPKGRLGEDTVRLIGSLIVAQVWQATLARAAQPEHQRRDASLLLDECQNFLHLPYRVEDMLAEARGFRLSLTLAHQHLAQLTPALRDGIAANARNKILFSLSPEDAAALARHTLPELGPHDLANLDGFHAAARLMTDGAQARPFTLTTRALPPPTPRTPDHTPAPPVHQQPASPGLDKFDPRRTSI